MLLMISIVLMILDFAFMDDSESVVFFRWKDSLEMPILERRSRDAT
jgi:hypothetical protein